MNDMFIIPEGDNRKPEDIALEWLLSQELKPGDTIRLADLDKAMCLIDPETLPPGRKAMTRWSLSRLPVYQKVLEEFEEQTGEILIPSGKGLLVVCDHELVAENVYEPAYYQVLKVLYKAMRRLKIAQKDDISAEELKRRNDAIHKASNIYSFARRYRRKSLSD